MIKKILVFLILTLFCIPIYAKAKLKVYPNPWIPESGKSLSTDLGDEMKHGAYTADGWIKFEGVNPENKTAGYSGTLRIYDTTGHLVRSKIWRIEDELAIPLPETCKERYFKDGVWYRNTNIVHWDGKNNDCEYVESGVYIWIITEDDGSKHDGKVVVIR